MKGGGGIEINKTKSRWSGWSRTRLSMMMLGPSSPAWRGGYPLLKLAMTLSMLVLLFSIYQSCVSHDFTLPDWHFVSRPSFLVASRDLSEQCQECPASATFLPALAFSLPFAHSIDSHLVETVYLETTERSTLPPVDSNSFAEETVARVVQASEQLYEKGDVFKGGEGNFNASQLTSSSNNSGSSTEKVVITDSWQGSNMTDSRSSSADNHAFLDAIDSCQQQTLNSIEVCSSTENNTLKESESALQEDENNWGKILEEQGEKRPPIEMVMVNNGTREMKSSGSIASTFGNQAVPQVTVRDDDVLVAPALPPPQAVPFVQLEVPKAAPTSPSFETELKLPLQIVENQMGEQQLKPEQELLAAKQAIKESTPADADPSLYPIIYWNISAFSKSYKLMEEMFRIYVYQEGDKQLVHTGPLVGIYSSEGKFIDRMNRGSVFIEQDPDKAHMFFLPYSVTQMTLTIYVQGSHSMLPLNTFVKDYVNEVAAKYSFWNRSQGADHFFVSCHDWGPATARDHEELRTNAVKVVCNADLTEEYVIGKDVSLPEIYLHNRKPAKVGGPGPSRRPYLAFFAGQMHGHVRPVLIEHWKDKDPDLRIYEVLPKKIERKMNYVQHMKNSKYCICAAGFEVNSPRIMESIYYDCVPVIIADNFVLPFSDVLNWNKFSVTIPESEIPNLKSILLSIPEKHYRAMQRSLSKVRRHFLWNDQPAKYDVFHMILHSVWMSHLNRLNL